jgi:NADP-dependent 3-hydroxy acid dehydrogenase YdfG
VVFDGAVYGNFIRSQREAVDDLLADDLILKPEDIAAAYVHIANQPRSAWTHELDLRPWREPF